jgi:GxxExxY protein
MEQSGIISDIRKSYDMKTYDLIGVALEVHKNLGCGFHETVYGDAFEEELKIRNIPYEREKELNVFYKDIRLSHHYFADFVCYGDIIVELKAIDRLTSVQESQVINYLKVTKFNVGLLFNFGYTSLEKKRIFNIYK